MTKRVIKSTLNTMYIWTLDIGNTVSKLVLYNNEELNREFILNTMAISIDIQSINFEGHPLVCGSVVPSADITEYINNTELIQPEISDLPINIDYKTIDTLGTDRIFAAYGAYCRFLNQSETDDLEYLFIIDSGTAITCDVFNINTGTYLGGSILIGNDKINEALHISGAQLPEINKTNEFNYPGKSTNESLYSGVYAQTNGAIQFLIDSFLSKNNIDENRITVFITGGNSEYVNIPYQSKFEKYLVNYGLLNAYINRLKSESGNSKEVWT